MCPEEGIKELHRILQFRSITVCKQTSGHSDMYALQIQNCIHFYEIIFIDVVNYKFEINYYVEME